MATWDQLPDESLDAFEAFCVFREMPKRHEDADQKRSIKNVSRLMGFKSITQCAKWSAKYNWRERTDAYRKSQLETALIVREGTVADFRKYVIESETRSYAVLDQILGMKARQFRDHLQAVMNGDYEGKEEFVADSRDIKALLDAYDKLSTMKRRTAMLPTQFVKRDVIDDGSDEEFIISVIGDGVEIEGGEAGDEPAQVTAGN